MKTRSNNDEIYIGRDAGQELFRRIKNAKHSVKIVSPYLSPNYIKELVHLSKAGKDVTLITCDSLARESHYSDFKVSDLVKKQKITDVSSEKARRKGMALSAVGFVTAIILLPIISLLSLALGILSFLIFSYYFFKKTYKIECSPIFRIKVFDSHSGSKPWSTELVHSKIFVIDEELAYLGSVNFTYSGFKTHYETIIKVEDKAAVVDISKEVEALYNSKELRSKDIEEWCGL